MLRKSTSPPDDILEVMEEFRSENTKLLTKQDLKDLPFKPQDVEPFHKRNTFTWRKNKDEKTEE